MIHWLFPVWKCVAFRSNLTCCLLLFGVICVVLWTLNTGTTGPQSLEIDYPRNDVTSCDPGVPCDCPTEVDLRVIVLTMARPISLRTCLESLQAVEIGHDLAILEIWIDRTANNQLDGATISVAENFRWRLGQVHVNIQKRHVGIYGQWVDTWRPKRGSKEISLILEDDVDVSAYSYRWIKAAHAQYDHRRDISGYSLSEVDIVTANNKAFARPPGVAAFLFRRHGTFGFSPHPQVWRDFQDWFHVILANQSETNFKPYVPEDYIFTKWYKVFERTGKTDGMWSMWFEYYTHHHGLYALFPNLGSYLSEPELQMNRTLAFHRREKGLHFTAKQRRRFSEQYLLSHWRPEYDKLPECLLKFNYTGKLVM